MSTVELDKKEQGKDLQALVWIASRRYILGEISIEELASIEKSYNLSIENALITLAIQQQKQSLLRFALKNIERHIRKLYFYLFISK